VRFGLRAEYRAQLVWILSTSDSRDSASCPPDALITAASNPLVPLDPAAVEDPLQDSACEPSIGDGSDTDSGYCK